MRPSNFKILMFILAALTLSGASFVNYEALVEAYGSGPPYYSRTTNMDKWNDPLPELILLDLGALAVAAALIWVGTRKPRKPGRIQE